jgi:hypothetical protein
MHILIGTPCYGGLIHNGYFQSMLMLQKTLNENGIEMSVLSFGNESLIQRGRNFVVAHFLSKTEFTHLLFIDSDISFDPSKIVDWIKSGKGIVSGIYPKKGMNYKGIVEVSKIEGVQPQDWEHLALDYVVNFNSNQIYVEGGRYIKALYVGTGMLLISREVILRLIQKFPQTKYTNDIAGYEDGNPNIHKYFYSLFDCFICPTSNRYLSEDYAFCQRCIDIGYDIWADISMNLTHTGVHHYQGAFGSKMLFLHYLNTRDTQKEKEKEKEKE